MIATLTRSMIVLHAIVWTGLALLLVQLAGLSWLAALPAAASVLLGLRAAIVFNNYLLSGALRQTTGAGKQVPFMRMTGCILQEFWWSMVCWFWLFPVGRPFSVTANDPGQLSVLLLHGYGANSGFWLPLSRRLRLAGISHAAIDLEPVLASIDDYASQISAAMDRLCEASGCTQLIVIGHSMGGLAARACLRTFGSSRVACLITLGTPHFGSTLAGYGVGLNARQMLPPGADSLEWVAKLDASEDTATRSLFICVSSRHDNIVSPQDSARLPGATNIVLDLLGHVALGFDAKLGDELIAEISSIRQNRSRSRNQ